MSGMLYKTIPELLAHLKSPSVGCSGYVLARLDEIEEIWNRAEKIDPKIVLALMLNRVSGIESELFELRQVLEEQAPAGLTDVEGDVHPQCAKRVGDALRSFVDRELSLPGHGVAPAIPCQCTGCLTLRAKARGESQ